MRTSTQMNRVCTAHPFELRVAELAALRVVAFEHLLAAAERLDARGCPWRVSSIVVVRIAGLVLDAADDRVVVALEPAAQHQDRDRGRHRQQRERHVEVEEQGEDRRAPRPR